MADTKSRFLIGIDLGTTNSVVAYIDTQTAKAGKAAVHLFSISQLIGPGRAESQPLLPSFLYVPGQYDLSRDDLALPWDPHPERLVGVFARDHGALVPGRLVSSVKSWLCHGGVDRNANILPWGGPPEVEKVSPVEASAIYLRHMREAWNYAQKQQGKDCWFEDQDIVLTVPASFDEAARELTLEAGHRAGLTRVTLLEEPLAAFYTWLQAHEADWKDFIQPNEMTLVCDIGGGTTDFSLITLASEHGRLKFRRIAVGEHLLLGGDNIDATLARKIESRLLGKPGKLDSARWHSLCHMCRAAKEDILSHSDLQEKTISIMGRGTNLIGGALQERLNRKEVEEIVFQQFFPLLDWNEALRGSSKRAGLSEWGLPYVSDPCVTRHLARFLQSHTVPDPEKTVRPDLILFNGGALTPRVIRERVQKIVSRWFSPQSAQQAWTPTVLENSSPELAVAQGAAYYGWVRRGYGIRVGAGMPRSYFIKVAASKEEGSGTAKTFTGLCVIERDMEEGDEVTVDRSFEAWANKPVRFDLYTSSVRMHDRVGEVYLLEEDLLHQLPPVRTVLRFGKKTGIASIPVRIKAKLTEVGTLALWCESKTTPHRWQLHFDLRREHPSADAREEVVLDEEALASADELLTRTFKTPAQPGDDPESLLKRMTHTLGMQKERWPLLASRRLAETLLRFRDGRTLGPQYEARWLNLTGFLLRPGFGHPLDEWKIKEVWKIFPQGIYFDADAQCKAEWWILWRRIAGGLESGHQLNIFARLRPYLLRQGEGKYSKGKLRAEDQELMEMWMAAASLERLPVDIKVDLGEVLMAGIRGRKTRRLDLWCLARLGARVPLYGPLDRVVPKEVVSAWIEKLLSTDFKNPQLVALALTHLARKCDDRQRDVDERVIRRIVEWLSRFEGNGRYQQLLLKRAATQDEERTELFGESLPPGLTIGDAEAATV